MVTEPPADRSQITPAAPTALDILDTPTGNYVVNFTGHLRGVEQGLAAVATRLSWYLGAMLGAIALAWLVVRVCWCGPALDAAGQ